MHLDDIIKSLNDIALELSFLDYEDNSEIEIQFENLTASIQNLNAYGLHDPDEFISCVKETINLEKEADLKQKLLSFCIDYLQNFLKSLSNDPAIKFNFDQFKTELNFLSSPEDSNSENTRLSEVNPDLVNEFIQTTKSSIENIESDILLIEKNGFSDEKVNNIFRVFHTIKSEANLIGLLNIGHLSHKTEDLLASVRSKNIQLDEDIIAILFETIDIFKNYIALLRKDFNLALSENLSKIINKFDLICKLNSSNSNKSNSNDKDEVPMNDNNLTSNEDTGFTASVPQLNLSDGSDMLTEFIAESREHLENSEEAVLSLETDPDDMEAVNLIFRAFHTIKGVTSFLELNDIKELAHTSETMLDLVRKKTLSFSEEVSETTLQSIDQLRKLLELLEEQITNGGTLSSPYFDVGPQIYELQGIIQQQPQTSAENGKQAKPVGEILIDEGEITPIELDSALDIQKTYPNKKVGEILQETNAASEKDVKKALNIQSGAGAVESSIKISVDKLDILVDLVGELVISETQVIQNESLNRLTDDRLVKDLSELDRITRSLQESAMSMRLVPVKSTFQKMVRIIRDLSKKSGKMIDVQLVGEETEIDKNMVELVSDPLIHMVRNSADHGIEIPEQRKAKGKDLKGTIELSAFHKGGNVVIQIRDNGAGLNKDKILKKAKERGIIDSEEGLPDKRIWNLIFEPGFSTAEKVTDVSGRGVGMDVVRKNIEKLRGRIDISSEKDAGSCFSIYLPITLAIIEGIVVRSGVERYIIPISSVIEFVCPEEIKKTDVVGTGELYRFHEEVIPIVYFDQLFSSNGVKKAVLEEKTICVCESEYGHYCFVVDEVLGQQQVVIKNLGTRLKNVEGVSGGAILGDGRVGLILDVNGLVEYHKKSLKK